jgi:hypothetical protein
MANSEPERQDDGTDVEQYPQGRDTSFQGPAGNLGGDQEIGTAQTLDNGGTGGAAPEATPGSEDAPGTQGG